MTTSEDRAHFTMWCMMASPLILGNDLNNMSKETLEIITNKDVIAIDQDPLGIQGLRLKKDGDLQYWFKPLENGEWAFCILNGGDNDQNLAIDWTSLEVNDELSGRSTKFANVNYNIKDLWNADAKLFTTLVKGKGKQRGQMVANLANITVKSHDVVTYRLTPITEKKK